MTAQKPARPAEVEGVVARSRPAALQLTGITKRFPGVLALDGVDLAIEHGSIHALLGENGAGKSTLVNVVAGRFAPDSGEVSIDGNPVRFTSPRDSWSQGVAVIHQELALLPDLSIAENVLVGQLPQRLRGVVDWPGAKRDAAEMAARIGLEADIDTRVGTLSTGEQQLVEIARALATRPRILVMDEPTSALSSDEVDRLFEVIDELRRQDLAILFISHRFEEIWRLCDRVTVVRDGRAVLARPLEDVSPAIATEAMIGHALEGRQAKRTSRIGSEALAARSVTTDWLQAVSLTLHHGEVLGLAGTLGSGRTEVLRVLAGADPVDEGSISIEGEPVALERPADAIARGVFLIPEDRKREGLILQMSIADNVSLPALGKVSKVGIVNRRAQARGVGQLIASLAIRATSPWQRVEKLSGGNQQKVVLARWLSLDPEVLLMDEPTRGIDVGAKEEIYGLIRDLAEHGVGIVFVASEVPELLRVCDRILVMRNGSVHAELDGRTTTETEIILAAQGTERSSPESAARDDESGP